MCGIGGYNIGSEVATEFGQRRAARLTRDVLLYNRHRGINAGGWYVQYDVPLSDMDGKYTRTFKQAGDPLGIDCFPEGKPVAMAAHTRAATSGSPDMLENDHPLIVGDSVIVHNGMISNDTQLKYSLSTAMGDGFVFPEVDSSVLAGGLNLAVQDWYDDGQLQKFVDFLSHDVHGSVAMAGSLATKPGVQVLARTGGSPLVVARHKSLPIVLWASEPDAVWKMATRFQKKHGDFWVAPMSTNSMLIVDHGRIVNSFSWDTVPSWNFRAKSYTMQRHTPYFGDKTLVRSYTTTDEYMWANDSRYPNSAFLYDKDSHAWVLKELSVSEMFKDRIKFDPDILQMAAEATRDRKSVV